MASKINEILLIHSVSRNLQKKSVELNYVISCSFADDCKIVHPQGVYGETFFSRVALV